MYVYVQLARDTYATPVRNQFNPKIGPSLRLIIFHVYHIHIPLDSGSKNLRWGGTFFSACTYILYTSSSREVQKVFSVGIRDKK